MTNRDDLLKRVSIDPRVCFGKPCIRGARIWVSLIVDNLAEGAPQAEILAAYPQLKPDDVRAALAYAAEWPASELFPYPSTARNDEVQARREHRRAVGAVVHRSRRRR